MYKMDFCQVWSAVGLLLLLNAPPGSSDLLMAYVVNRHGARNALAKTAFLKESASIGGVTLLPQGQKMCYDAGMMWLQPA